MLGVQSHLEEKRRREKRVVDIKDDGGLRIEEK